MQSDSIISNSRPQSRRQRRAGHWLAALAGMAAALTFVSLYVAPTVGSYTAERFADPAMVQLADDAGMNEHGRKLFLGTRPQLLDQAALAKACAGVMDGPDITVFGCYDHGQNRIYLRDMDSRFDGVEVTTAAHEMLHVAYHELSDVERERIDGLVKAESAIRQNEGLDEDIATYEGVSDDVRRDELHAFIGSEYDIYHEELDTHYAQYFSDRAKPVQANAGVERAFDELSDDIDRRMAEIDRLEAVAQGYYTQHEQAAYDDNAYGAEYYYGLYESQYAQLQQLLGESNLRVDQYNVLVTMFNGQPLETVTARR